MRSKFKIIGFCCLLTVTFYACKKDTSATENVNLPVVEAYLMAGKAVTVKVYQQKAITDTAKYGPAIKGLEITVSDGSKTVALTESAAGTYTYADPAFLAAGKTYSVQFKYLAYAVSASTVMPAKPLNFATQHATITIDGLTGMNSAIDTLNRFTWSNPDSLNHVLLFNNLDGIDFPATSFGNNRAVNFIINTDRAASYELTQRPFSYYGHFQVVLLRVNKEYIDLLTSNTSSTSANLSSQPTNVVNGFGIFTAMQADTVSLNVF